MVDIHKDWCGPCEVMKPTYRKLFLELDDAENRVQFLTANISKLAAFAEYGEDPSVRPLFKMFKVGSKTCSCCSISSLADSASPARRTAMSWR